MALEPGGATRTFGAAMALEPGGFETGFEARALRSAGILGLRPMRFRGGIGGFPPAMWLRLGPCGIRFGVGTRRIGLLVGVFPLGIGFWRTFTGGIGFCRTVARRKGFPLTRCARRIGFLVAIIAFRIGFPLGA